MGAWVREVVGHSAPIAPSRRYHFAGQTALIVTAYRYHFMDCSVPFTYPTSADLRISFADYQAVPASDPIMTRLVAVKDLRCAARP